ncbi:hypothetical protein [Plantactinospora sonchi]|uniref:Glycosyltransferase RgtA/B/C/D-like domain-containing protein n=1 Tax=Plantactinospora sonchi TaxID=1544735 RepID=A0ABU7RM32_9ACTN
MALVTLPESTASTRWRFTAGRVAVGLALLGLGYRLAMLLAEVPPSNSDEAVTGLVAVHVAQGRAFPLFFYGQYYMGALESYLAAPLLALLGSSTFLLRLPNLLLYAAFLALMWRLTRRLYTPWLATFTVGLLALGSDRILKNQLIAAGGYPEMNPAGALLVLLAVNLGLGAVRRTGPAYAGFGLVAGLTLWDDWLVLPYVGVAGGLLLAARWRQLTGRPRLALGAGLLVGLVPIVVHNLTAAPEHRSLAVYAALGGGAPASWPDRLGGAILLGLPMGTGLCDPGRCAPWQRSWGVVLPLLLVAAVVLAGRGLLRADQRAERIRQGGRLALAVGAALTLSLYASSSAAANTPVESARYLSCLLISTPALLWPLWSALTRPGDAGVPVPARRLVRRAAAVPLVALAGTMALASVALVGASPGLSRQAEQRRELVTALDRLGVRHFYAEYWTCNNIIFLTRERIVCGVIRNDLSVGWDRYPAYPEQVAGASRPAFVLPVGSGLSAAVRDRLAGVDPPHVALTTAGYDIYLPADRVDLPRRPASAGGGPAVPGGPG